MRKTADNTPSSGIPNLLRARGVTLKQIRYFLAVAYNGTVTSAAQDLYISPGSVTEAVKNLEEALEVTLFERRRSGMALTREGDRFRDYCEKILFLLEDALRAVNKPSNVKGDLRIAASPVVLGYFLPSLLSRFQQVFPGVRLHLLELERGEIEKQVTNRSLDAGVLLVSNASAGAKFRKHKLYSSPRLLWCAAIHPFAEKESVSLSEIAQENYIQLLIDEAERNTAQFWKKHRLRPQVILRTETIEAVRGYIGQNVGVTILSGVLFRQWSLEGDRIVAKPVVESIPAMDVGMIWPRGELSPQTSLFLDFLSFYGWQGAGRGFGKTENTI